MSDDGFWKDKKVMVTGGSGFIGSHLVELLLEAGAEVSIIARSDKNVKRNLKEVTSRIDTSKPEGQPRRNCDTKKLKAKVGFSALKPLSEGLKDTIEWYKSNEVLR